MDFRTLSAAFVVAQPPVLTVERVLDGAGLAEGSELREYRAGYGLHDPDTPAVQGTWPAVGRVWGRVDPVGDHQLVQLFFSYNTFIDLWNAGEDVPLAEHPLKPLADAFGAAGAGLDAEVGWIDGLAHHGEEDWETRTGSRRLNTAWARKYLEEGVQAIIDERFSVTWMRNDVSRVWAPDFTRAFETTDSGWLLWADDEPQPWF